MAIRPPETTSIPIDEAHAAAVVERALEDAVREMELTVQRMLARGPLSSKDRAWIAQLTAALDELAAEWGGKVVRGPWGKQIAQAIRDGAGSLELPPGVKQLFTIDRRLIDVALYTREVKIRGILSEGVRWVNDLMAAAMIRGDSLKAISAAVEEGLKLANGAAVPAWRADLIARNEPFAAYRETAKAAADANGVKLFQMRGVVDTRTSAICLRYLGKVMTAQEWLAVSKYVFRYGLHVN